MTTPADILAACQTLKPLPYGSQDILHACGWNVKMIPADWIKRGVLSRSLGKGRTPERFAFYQLSDGRVAEISFHPMNGANDLSVCVRSAEAQRNRWNELLAGEEWEQRSSIGYGRIDCRKGRYAKARRVA